MASENTGDNDILTRCSSRIDVTSDGNELLNCVTTSLSDRDAEIASALDFVFLLYATTLVFVMQAGFAMLCAGSVRRKNVQNSMLKNLLDACGAAIGFWSFGYAFAYSPYGDDDDGSATSFIGNKHFFLVDLEVSGYGFWLFQFAFAATAATIVAGTLAERCQMVAYLCYSLVLTGFVYPIIVRAIWSEYGFLNFKNGQLFDGIGMVDFAGSGVVHITGGCTSLLATKILGPRKGRFFDARGRKLEAPKRFPGHSPALQVLGTFLLWFGWYGFNAGSIVSIASKTERGGYSSASIAILASINTTLSAASGCVSALFTRLYFNERRTGEATFDLQIALNGAISGLVAVTGGCSVVNPWAAVVIGTISGWVYLLGSNFLIRHCIDDAVDAIPVHFANGCWGVIATGLLAAPKNLMNLHGTDKHVGWLYEWGRGSGNATLLMAQLVGILFIVGWVMIIMSPFFFLLNYCGLFRADSLEEVVGLDISYHGGEVYQEEEVKREYIQEYQERKVEKKNSSSHSTVNMTPTVSGHSSSYPVHPVLSILKKRDEKSIHNDKESPSTIISIRG